MAIPLFYAAAVEPGSGELELNEETSKHVVQVLRMKIGEQLQVTDGKGNVYTTALVTEHKKKATVKILSSSFLTAPEKKISIAIALIKNANRFEWFVEKATEIGVTEIIPLICNRTEKQHFRFERINGIMISAMLQSQQSWLPVLHEPIKFGNLWQVPFGLPETKLIAHCVDDKKDQLLSIHLKQSAIILIGPEGDFTSQEIVEALKHDFIPVALGETRLRTETAGVVAATLMRNL